MNKQDIPWVQLIWQCHYNNNNLPQAKGPCGSFWWRDFFSLWDQFMNLTNIQAGSGKTIRFWKDKWMNPIAKEDFPHLFSFAKKEDMSIGELMNLATDSIFEHFHLPLSIIAS